MSRLDEIIERVGEIAHFYPNLDFGYIFVSIATYHDLMVDLNKTCRHAQYVYPGDNGQGLALQTHLGQLYVKAHAAVEDDDFELMDRSGLAHSYKHFFVNEMVEKILLTGETT